jgi:cytochrome c-type biogenesis protein
VGDLFTGLTAALDGAPHVALAAAFAWGVLSIVLSPCHLASIPLIIGFIQGQERATTGRAALLSTLFAVGILVNIAVIGVLTAAAGRLLGDVGSAGNLVVAAILIGVGLVLMDVIPLPLPDPARVGMQRRGALAALVLGLVFGLALGPCTFAFMAPMLAVTFKVAATSVLFGGLLLTAYGVGHCALIVAAGSCTAWAQRVLDWNAASTTGLWIKRVCGLLVILGGFYLLHIAH